MTCDGAVGTSYTFEGGIAAIVGRTPEPWKHDDGIPNGSFVLIKNVDDYDIIITDATGSTVSARVDGAQVYTIAERPGEWVVTVLH